MYKRQFTNPASTKAGEYGLTRVTCFLACRLELDAVAGLLWISWDFVVCFGWGADFSVFFFFLRTHTACCKHEAASCLIYLSTSTGFREGRSVTRSNLGLLVCSRRPVFWARQDFFGTYYIGFCVGGGVSQGVKQRSANNLSLIHI